ncbi:Sodium/hydrogen exchanger family protein [Seinonella peptonophila]|uniref:Sodium/hydrogen exchanger family protein n=1 Tax=Seinonella peptonophila TaxID=112248 RepID=A0A1M4XH52_9BACL|nr:cation:proton antiporter [Seinonella peptonophila]SHE92884.1 Sodium/hydrogen exchanger family protein [Seinonella peptonophila]
MIFIRLFLLFFLALLGFLFANALYIHHPQQSDWYQILIYTLLAIGLYSSTYQIEKVRDRAQVLQILQVIVFGVLLKVILIGGLLFLLSKKPIFLLLGVVVAQIDPLSVAALMGKSKMSSKARTLLAFWSSFDDPVTVILSLFILQFATKLDDQTGNLLVSSGLLGQQLLLVAWNFVFAAMIYLIWKGTYRYPAFQYVWVVFSIIFAIYAQLMLGIALIGLFLRPAFGKFIDYLSNGSLAIATFLLGMLMVNGWQLLDGLWVALAAIFAQIIVVLLLTRRMDKMDRVYLAFGQQNGITAIILALTFETTFPGIIAITAPAIFIINLIHLMANSLLDKRMEKNQRYLSS